METISIHALREEGDVQILPTELLLRYFYPRPPRGGRPKGIGEKYLNEHISIHALREEGDPILHNSFQDDGISIHALREEGDVQRAGTRQNLKISIHALREEGDCWEKAYQDYTDISIHALREEGDNIWAVDVITSTYFYPRPPRGGRRASADMHLRDVRISIHALREEGDRYSRPNSQSQKNFYPRPPRGGRLTSGYRTPEWNAFLSTPSARRATRPQPAV